ncbi:MAG: class II aldolase/adducin family protein [Chloroflexota bacterium]
MFERYKNMTLQLVQFVNAPRQQNYAQYRNRHLLKESQKQELSTTGRLLVERSLAHATTGEVSLRLGSSQLVVNTLGSDLAQLTEQQLVVGTLDNDKSLGDAARHLDWHRMLYAKTSAQAVILCQPAYALTLANAQRLPEQPIAPEIFQSIGEVTMIHSDELYAERNAAVFGRHHALLIPNIGALVWGKSPSDAARRVEALEYVSRLTVLRYQVSFEPSSIS